MRTTHTFVELELSPFAFDEIKVKLNNAGYQHAFYDTKTTDMHGIAVTRGTENIPIEMLLLCPQCLKKHIDQPQPEKGWTNPPHREHECQHCGMRWRPSNYPTIGVESLTPMHRYVAATTYNDVCKCGARELAAEHY